MEDHRHFSYAPFLWKLSQDHVPTEPVTADAIVGDDLLNLPEIVKSCLVLVC
jgi:hypothetical protein